jgi:hypothetical protein
MKCDRVLSSMATGGVVARWRARRHVARCHKCALAQIQLREITRELAEAPPLTAAQRALWTAAGTEPTASRPWPVWVHRVGLAAAAVLLGAIVLKLWGPQLGGGKDGSSVVQVAPQPLPLPPAPNPVPSSERGRLASEMLAKVDRLDHDLAELRREADLLDVRKDADTLWARYAPHKPSTL